MPHRHPVRVRRVDECATLDETLEGAVTLGGNAVFPVELTLAVSSALRKLTAD